jgi:hypothetical protein
MTHRGHDAILRNDRERAEYGCIVTFENSDGKVWIRHVPGPPRAGLRKACDEALALDETFRVVSYSTPSTVYQDMQGARRSNSYLAPGGAVQSVEGMVLGLAGRREMLHPRISR